MIERLVHTLQAFAAPADVQLARVPDFAARADELARDFADALLLASDCPQLRLTAGQRHALESLDAHLDAMSGAAAHGTWTDDAVRSAPEWAAARHLALAALEALGALGADSPGRR